MRSFLLRPLMVAALPALAAACVSAQESPMKEPPKSAANARPLDTTPWQLPPAQIPALAPADYAAFGLGLFRQLGDARPDQNVVVSPLSAGLAVSMLANGAQGQTLAGIQQALGTGMDLDGLNGTNAALAQALRSGDVELAIANSLWARQGVPFLPSFMERNQRYYQAEVAALDFSSPQAAARINRWVSDKTNGRITRMVEPPIDGDVVMYLMNAVYFKGRWQDEFRASATRPLPFRAPRGTVQRPMMTRTGSYGYLDGDGFSAVRLPYRGGRFAMYVLLPDASSGVAALRRGLTPQAWAGWMEGFGTREVRVVMPKYRVNVESRLNAPLAALGMTDAFSQTAANFGALLPAEYLARGNVYVSEAKQKVFVEVNEEGTEAAAVTGIEMRATSAPPPPAEFVVDRPFILAIRDDTTGALLFIGQVNDPVTED
ncbi:MAG TPA: serpin family protein [Longimicrobium sp.]|jgi:serpin B|uniref:serpin family protein n=1 Tax=Longimicrobium sp. TaxID=2029185 RepID=UPI002ED840D6